MPRWMIVFGWINEVWLRLLMPVGTAAIGAGIFALTVDKAWSAEIPPGDLLHLRILSVVVVALAAFMLVWFNLKRNRHMVRLQLVTWPDEDVEVAERPDVQ